jgi:hypothetical protein
MKMQFKSHTSKLVLAVMLAVGSFSAQANQLVTATVSQAFADARNVSPSALPQVLTATCPAGYSVIGGGYSFINGVANSGFGPTAYLVPSNQVGYAQVPYFIVTINMPNAAGTGWTVGGVTNDVQVNLTVYARCISAS